MGSNGWAKHTFGRWGHIWALTMAGVVVLALIVLAGQKDWFADDTLFGFALLGVAAGVFGAAYALTTRQLKADARKALFEARSKIEQLTAQIEKLKEDLQAARKKLLEVERDVTTNTTIAGALPGAAADLASIRTSLEAVERSATSAEFDLSKATGTFTDAIEDLPEGQRLVGLWVAAGLTIVLLGFLAATGLTITTSTDDPTNPGTTETTNADPTETS